jgi:hypothetical protein
MAMSDDSKDREELHELEMLLPFHAIGRLTPPDVARAERYFSDHPDRWQLLSEEKDAVVAGNEAISARRAHSFARVAAAISATRDQPVSRGVFNAIRLFFERPSGQSVRWAGAIAAVLIIMQAATIGRLAVTQYSKPFATASGEPVSREPGSFAAIRFADGATASAIAMLLADLDMRVVDGPAGGGLSTVRIGPQGMSDAERDRAIASLKARSDVVAFVTRLQ